jgi:hypothetical protein
MKFHFGITIHYDWKILGKDAAPAASLHGRTKSTKPEITPAPGDYNPQKAEKIILDSSPKYTFGVKTQVEKISCTPGKPKSNLSKRFPDSRASRYKHSLSSEFVIYRYLL